MISNKCWKKIALNEKIEIEDDVLTSIASASDGGLRDAIGLLDKLSSYKLGKITYNDFLTMNGQIIENELLEFAKYYAINPKVLLLVKFNGDL